VSYQALYRAWRPQQFVDLVGQPHVKQTLTNALTQGHVAHAYLFCGPRGTGKTSVAKVLAKAVNCLEPIDVEPCNACAACVSITNGSNVDVEEIDAASNRGVDEIRQLRDKVQYAPASLKKKVYIVDEVHMLTTEAFNALLKTLEEPPLHAMFVLATTEAHKIPGTIVSRCQRFDFRRIAVSDIVSRLTEVCADEGWAYEASAIWKIAETADGGLRDALGILEQTAAYGRGEISEKNAALVVGGVETSTLLQLGRALAAGDLLGVVERLGEWYGSGKEASRIAYDVLQMLRDLLVMKLSRDVVDPRLESVGYAEVANNCTVPWLLQAVQKIGETYTSLRYVEQPRLALEATLLGLSATPVPEYETPRTKAGERTVSVPNVVPAETAAEPAATVSATGSADSVATTARGAKATGRPAQLTATARKKEALAQLVGQAQPDMLARVQAGWGDILHHVKANRIQTHAWLMNGEAVLATANAVVLSFSSRIHRDAVMKSDERLAIESAIVAITEHSLQIFALLRTDWEAFAKTANAPQDEANAVDIAAQAVRLFGKERVQIQDEE